jgi:transposase
MKTPDARSLSAEAQEALRVRVVHAVVVERMPQSHAARAFNVSRTAVYNWVQAHRRGGRMALRRRPRGRPPRPRLAGHQAATTVRMISDRCPDQLKLPFSLWTRQAVQQLLAERFGIQVSVWTVGRYLKRWGFTPQKPVRRAYEQNPQAVEQWLKKDYPAIRKRAKAERAEIHWGDEMGLRSDYQAGRSYGRRGRTPVIPGTGQRFSCNMISTITNRGRLTFMVFKGSFNTPVMISFLKRLLRQVSRKIFLVLDGHPVHRSIALRRWLEDHAKRIELFFLPGYSPQLNPDELLNHDVKVNALGRKRPQDQAEMIGSVRSHLRGRQRQPKIVRNYFHEPHVMYAAD